ncbi:hypothetical protein VTK56DRAFT_2505 [Thermocarpiscus australiensis]
MNFRIRRSGHGHCPDSFPALDPINEPRSQGWRGLADNLLCYPHNLLDSVNSLKFLRTSPILDNTACKGADQSTSKKLIKKAKESYCTTFTFTIAMSSTHRQDLSSPALQTTDSLTTRVHYRIRVQT